MAHVLLADLSGFLSNGAFAAILLCAGLAIGLTIGKRQIRHVVAPHRVELQRLIGLLAPLVDWTRGLAEDMSQYRSVVCGVSQLFRDGPERLGENQRVATANLLSRVVEANEQLQKRLNEAEYMLKEQATEMSVYMSEARTDALTGLPNRRAFDEELGRRLAEWRRYRRPLAVVMVDVDHFKRFNDTYGHQTGDEVLRRVAKLLHDTMRESDLVVRYGGEEMAVILPGTDIQEACRAAQRARQAIEAACLQGGPESPGVTVSLGAAECLEADSATGLVKRADDALYAAKQAGRNRVYWHDGYRCLSMDGQLTAGKSLSTMDPGPTREHPANGRDPSPSFADICQDLRRRMEQVALTATDQG